MQKTIITIVIIALVAIGGYFMFMKESTVDDKQLSSEETAKMEDGVSSDTGKKMAFSNFIAQGGSYKCNVTQYLGETSSQGTVFVDNGKARGEFKTSINGANIDSNFIINDGFMYSWSSMSKMGIKMPVQANTSTNSDTQTNTFNADQIGDYDCVTWAADASMFTAPANISFTVFKQ